MDIDKVAEALKLDTDKVFQALPAIAVIVEKSDIIDMTVKISKANNGVINKAAGMKIAVRLLSRMKEYENEVDEVLTVLFNQDVSKMTTSEKGKLIKEILLNKDIDDFF